MGKEWDFSPSTPGILDDISDIHFWNPWESPVSGHPASVPWYISGRGFLCNNHGMLGIEWEDTGWVYNQQYDIW